MPARRCILITGATGNIGRKLHEHLRAAGQYELRRLCLNPSNNPDVATADLRTYDKSWTRLFEGVDAVVHLANVPTPLTSWDPATRGNIEMTLNVYNAAAEHHVGRVIFASSVWAMYGYRFRAGTLRADMTPNPGKSHYGMAKIIGERIGKSFFERFGISTVALRIGACQPGKNLPGKHMVTGRWGQDCWVSNRDICQGIEKSIFAENISFAVLNMTSSNTAGRWSLAETEKAIGYVPQDSHTTEVSFRRAVQEMVGRVFLDMFPAAARCFALSEW